MLKPFWRSIATSVVKDLHTRPQKIQQLSDLFGISVNQFLHSTQPATVPSLVLMKKKDVLQRIAFACGPTKQIFDICKQPPRTLAATLALLLQQQSSNIEELTMEHLCEVAPEFRNFSLLEWLQIGVIPITCEMLKAASDRNEDKRPNVSG